MKKRKLKKWVKNLLMGVIVLAFVVIGVTLLMIESYE